MTFWRTTKAWRAVTFGVTSGAAGLLGAGCRSADPAPAPLPQPNTALYPGLRSTAPAPVILPGESGARSVRPVVAPVAVTASAPGRVLRAEAIERKGPPAAPGPDLPPPPAPADAVETIDLGVALRLAGVDNPTVNLARERVREALAGQLLARSLLLPNINIGGNYRFHSGPLEDDPGEFRNINLQSLYLGFGAGAVGTNPAAVPGVRLFAHLGDAVYEPLAARQRVTARRSDAQAVQNQILLDVAVAYLDLVGAEARLDILGRAETQATEVARVTAEFARTGQGAPPDANRAEARAELIRRQLRQAEGAVAAAAARLARLLNLDPSVRLRSPGGTVDQIRLLPEDTDLEELLATAARSRPELVAWAAAIQEARTRVRQEQMRPLAPTVSAGFSAGLFGGGGTLAPSNFGPLNGRSDFDLVAVWNVQNLGLGNRARVRAADAGVGLAVAGYDAALNQVRREVAAAQADAQAAAQQIRVARAAVADAEDGYKREAERVRRGEGRPIEALDSLRLLLDARQELLFAVVAFDVAQFRLFVGTGSTPITVPECQTPARPAE
ncbi:MAG TPA: TolC family protein [Urbifossiella sp.]|nr:TolC family protein [Urbifossiella sp.]